MADFIRDYRINRTLQDTGFQVTEINRESGMPDCSKTTFKLKDNWDSDLIIGVMDYHQKETLRRMQDAIEVLKYPERQIELQDFSTEELMNEVVKRGMEESE